MCNSSLKDKSQTRDRSEWLIFYLRRYLPVNGIKIFVYRDREIWKYYLK